MACTHAEGEEATRYNAQLDVFSARNKLVGNGRFPDLLTRAEEIAHKFDVANLFGVRLLHKHNDIADGERMVEFEGRRATRAGASIPVLETVCVSASDAKGASIWAFARNGNLLPLEYSSRVSGMLVQRAITDHREFVDTFTREVYARDLQGVIGLCMPNFEFARKHVSSERGMMIEHSDDARRANVITVQDRRNIDPSNYIPTTWTFAGAAVGCGTWCEITDGVHKKVEHVPDDD